MMPNEPQRRRYRRYIEALIAAKGDVALAARRLHFAKIVVRLTLREIETALSIDLDATVAVPVQRIDQAQLVRALLALAPPSMT